MYQTLLHYMSRRPPLYAPSTSAFWDDEHISQYMLQAHLDPQLEAATRKHDFVSKSASWITQLWKPQNGNRLLDLGCGPGFYAEHFCRAGLSVTGVDLSRRSIAYAREQAEAKGLDIQYLCQNYLELKVSGCFDIATLIYCDFGVLSPTDRQRLLRNVRKALRKGGLLILDVWTHQELIGYSEWKRVEYCEQGFWSSVPYLCIQSNYLYPDTDNFLEQYVIVTEQSCECYNIWNQAFSRETLGRELTEAGFPDLAFYDDVSGAPYSGQAATLCVVAR